MAEHLPSVYNALDSILSTTPKKEKHKGALEGMGRREREEKRKESRIKTIFLIQMIKDENLFHVL